MESDFPGDAALAQSRTRGEARRALLRARGLTLAALARELGCHLSVVSRVNAGKKRSAPVEDVIARHLQLPLDRAFPEWYGAVAAVRSSPGPVRAGRGSGSSRSRSARRSAPG
jgi:transcriptional regulator with XRE-family HTH domain